MSAVHAVASLIRTAHLASKAVCDCVGECCCCQHAGTLLHLCLILCKCTVLCIYNCVILHCLCLVLFFFSHLCSCLLREELEPNQLCPHCRPSLVVTVCIECICFNSSVRYTHQTDETFASCSLLITFHSVCCEHVCAAHLI